MKAKFHNLSKRSYLCNQPKITEASDDAFWVSWTGNNYEGTKDRGELPKAVGWTFLRDQGQEVDLSILADGTICFPCTELATACNDLGQVVAVGVAAAPGYENKQIVAWYLGKLSKQRLAYL